MSDQSGNIAAVFVQTAQRLQEKPAIIESRTSKSMSFRELDRQSDAYMRFLHQERLQPGDKVMLMVRPSCEFISIALALFKLGATIILIDPGMGYKNLLRCIAGVKPRVLIGIPQAVLFSRLFRQPFRSVDKFFSVGLPLWPLARKLREAPAAGNEVVSIHSPKPTDLAAIIFTTGSTGPPKGVRYEHSIFYAQLELIRSYYQISDQDVDQPGFPLFALFSAALGATAVIPDMNPTQPAKVDPERFVASLRKYRVSYSFGSPAIWKVVSSYCRERSVVLTDLKKVLMAGAPVPFDLIRQVQSILSADAHIYTPYGATESLPSVSIEGREISEETWELTRQGRGTCVGRPLPGMELAIMAVNEGQVADFAQATLLGPGEIGEILVRGPVVTRAYENNEEETSLAKIRDGLGFWHRMGDLGYIDGRGRLWFCGRKAHRVVTATATLYSVCCEAIVNEHAQVSRSALVGITLAHSSDFKTPVLIVEPIASCDLTEETLLQEVAGLAALSPLTREIEYFLVHPDFPVDIRHNAKIFREKLAVWAQNIISQKKPARHS